MRASVEGFIEDSVVGRRRAFGPPIEQSRLEE
jgi:hypothetical protein